MNKLKKLSEDFRHLTYLHFHHLEMANEYQLKVHLAETASKVDLDMFKEHLRASKVYLIKSSMKNFTFQSYSLRVTVPSLCKKLRRQIIQDYLIHKS